MKPAHGAPLFAIVTLAIVLTACGGGSTRTATPRPPEPPQPPGEPVTPPQAGAVLKETTGWLANPNAGDLAKHWHITVAPEAIRDALSLEAAPQSATAKLNTIARVVGMAAPGNVEVLGRTKGYSVGRWTAGPADHTPIRLEWKMRDDEVDSEVRAQSERAAKLWSHHLSEPYEPYRLPETDAVAYEALGRSLPYHEYSEPDGPVTYGTHVVVLASPEDAPPGGRGYPTHFGCGEQPFPCKAARQVEWYDPAEGTTVLRPTIAASRRVEVYLHPVILRNEISESPGLIMAHELGHGFYLYTVSSGEPKQAYTGQWWGNPGHATGVHGGPIPYQGAPYGEINETHWADSACPTLMAYGCPGTQVGPSALDVAFLKDHDYPVATAAVAGANEMYSLGAWGEVSAFEVSVERDLDSYTDDRLRASAAAYGSAPASTLASSGGAGTATWNGLVLGADLGSAGAPPVIGDATLTLDLDTMRGDARFTNLVVLSEGTRRAFRSPALAYDVSATGNTFEDTDGYVHGAWYGSGHQEVAGTVLDRRPGVDLTAAFGASRSE